MDLYFHPHELRVLGCLLEKRFSTPDSYPLTMSSLIAACNQSSNRDPVVQYDQSIVDSALKGTRVQGYSLILTSADSRVPRFKENLCDKLGLRRPEAAVLAELMLRGPQTPGELRQRTARMHDFPDLPSVDAVLRGLAERQPPLVTELPRQPGKRESRYAHLLAGPVEVAEAAPSPPPLTPMEERLSLLEQQMAEVLERLQRLAPP